jgi:hypothetical protein
MHVVLLLLLLLLLLVSSVLLQRCGSLHGLYDAGLLLQVTSFYALVRERN